MAPQTEIPLAATVLGLIGTILWCVQLVPQIIRNYRAKSTAGLPATMMFLWSLCSVPFGAYAIIQNFNIPIMVQPQCFGVLCLVSWGQCLLYGKKWRVWTVTFLTATLLLFFGGLEVLLIFVIRGPYSRGVEWPVTLIGVVAACLLIVGYVPVPFELWKRRGRVVGIDFGMLTMDWLGAVFSLMAIAAQHTFDILGGVMYAACAAIEASIFISQAVWLIRTRHIRQKMKEAKLTWEGCPEAQTWQDNRLKFPFDWKIPGFTTTDETKVGAAVGDDSSIEKQYTAQDSIEDVEQCRQ